MSNLIYNEDGRFSDAFEKFASEAIEPKFNELVDIIKVWLIENNATGKDYMLAFQAALDFSTYLHDGSNAWMDYIHAQQFFSAKSSEGE